MMDQLERKKPGPKPRGLGAADMSVDEAYREGVVMGDDRDPNTAVVQERVRIPLNQGQHQSLRGYKLDTENFRYYWFHDSEPDGSRIMQARDAFYEHCEINGSVIKTPSGSGYDYLMRLPMKYYLEDVAAERKRHMAMQREQARLAPGQYSTDERGRLVESGEMGVRKSVSDNPYS